MNKNMPLRMAILSQVGLVSTLALATVGYWNAAVPTPAKATPVGIELGDVNQTPPLAERVALSVSLAAEDAWLPADFERDDWEEFDDTRSIFDHFRNARATPSQVAQ